MSEEKTWCCGGARVRVPAERVVDRNDNDKIDLRVMESNSLDTHGRPQFKAGMFLESTLNKGSEMPLRQLVDHWNYHKNGIPEADKNLFGEIDSPSLDTHQPEPKRIKLENTGMAQLYHKDKDGFITVPLGSNDVLLPAVKGNIFNDERWFHPYFLSFACKMGKRLESNLPCPLSTDELNPKMLLADEIRTCYGGEGAMAREKAATA